MAKIAVLKPDHLGDFVLSLPAYQAILRVFGRFDLYAAPSNRFIYDSLLRGKDVTFCPLQLPHLVKTRTAPCSDDDIRAICESYDFIFYLRDDNALTTFETAYPRRFYAMKPNSAAHETALQRDFLLPWIGYYSRSELMYPLGMKWPDDIRHVGLVLSAGFTSNKLPLSFWLEFARMLTKRKAVALTIIAGPQERDEANMFLRLLGQDKYRLVVGSENVASFRSQIACCDVAVGADSGTLHLVSTVMPVLGLYTSSPWVRYAPFGRHNRIQVANVPCSPCIQFSKSGFNGCLSRECAGLMRPADVMDLLFYSGDGVLSQGAGVAAVFGPSHFTDNRRG